MRSSSITHARAKYRQLLGVIALTILGTTHQVIAAPAEEQAPCKPGFLARTLAALKGQTKETATLPVEPPYQARKIQTLDDLMLAFTEGFEPDLTNKEQRNAFEVYRKMRFGDPNTNLPVDATERVASQLNKHPELSKQRFRNFKIEAEARSYPVTPTLATFVDPQIKGAAQVRSYLFQVGENRSFWKKIFQYEEPPHLRAAPEGADKAALKQLKVDQSADWEKFLALKISPEMKALIENPATPAKERAQKLYAVFAAERKVLQAAGKDIKPISQAMVDLIHTIGLHDEVTLKQLKSVDGMERLEAFRKVLAERDGFAEQLGFEKHFNQALKDLGLIQPTGVASVKGQSEKIQAIESELVAAAKIVKGNASSKTVRHLSTVESPFRSCLGGSDCSSRTYLTRALDPNYHYFTVTDEQGFSTGHITVVLGEAKTGGEKVKVAFVDKIQNVDNLELPTMMEAVRRSLEEKGYILALPEDMGGINGISNEDVSRRFIQKKIPTDSKVLTKFKPFSHAYKLDTYASRADDSLPIRAVLPLKTLQGVALTPADVAKVWRTDDFKLSKLVQASIDLKHGDTDDKLRYISSMKTIEKAGLKGDPDFDATVGKWMADPGQPFKLRKQVLTSQWLESKKPLSRQLDAFSADDQITLVQNFLDTPRLRKEIVSNKKDIPELLARVRKNAKVRDMLLAEYAPKQSEPMSIILAAPDLSNDKVASALTVIKTKFDSTDVNDFDVLLQQTAKSSVEPAFQKLLIKNYLKNAQAPEVLGRGLTSALNSPNPSLVAFGEGVLAQDLGANRTIVKSFKEMRQIQNERKIASFGEAATVWMKNEATPPEQKAEVALTQMGGGAGQFDVLLEKIPASQRKAVWKHIEDQTSLGTLRHLAKKAGVNAATLEKGVIESFLYRTVHTAEKGPVKFKMGEGNNIVVVTLTRLPEVQAAPVTQLEYALTVGKNPSRFVDEGVEMTINGKKMKVDPNRPVEQVSWDDAQAFIKLKNQAAKEAGDPYEYRLLTEAEWEFFARSGSESNEPVEGWHYQNSGGKTQPIAKFSPNGYGLYDMHGNVWEWTQDTYQQGLPGGVDPSGGPSGSYRVLRGGGWDYDPRSLRSGIRDNYSPGFPYDYVGLRLVRARRK